MPSEADEPLMLVSMPNSGSTWLADILARNITGCRYCLEFFNPILNTKYERELAPVCGCELHSCVYGITNPPSRRAFDELMAATWDKEAFTFTKEVFSSYWLHLFLERFHCVVMVSDESLALPPSMNAKRVIYEHIHAAQYSDNRFRPVECTCVTVNEKMDHAFSTMRDDMVATATMLDLPILKYRWLIELDVDRLIPILSGCRISGLDYEAAAAEIVATRRWPEGRR